MEIVIRILLFIDCIVNFLTNGKITETLSARAYRMRERRQPVWGWTADAIDWCARKVFGQVDHCRKAFEAEKNNGGALTWMPRWLFVEIL